MLVLIESTPLDPATGNRVTVRACSAEDRTITALNGQRWWPAISEPPTLQLRLFEGDFSSDVNAGQAKFALQVDTLAKEHANARRFVWQGAFVTIRAGVSGQVWPWPVVFEGEIETFRARGNRVELSAKVQTAPFDADVLTLTYAGTGGAEGGTDLKGKTKPWAFGAPANLEPVLVDAVNSVFQASAYGAVQSITAVYERASAFGAATGDHASYAALVAATIPAGRWASCNAQGMFRLGAPPFGLITCDVEGDAPAGVWRRRTGAIIERIAANAGVSGTKIDSASLAALDAAVPRNVSLYLTEQISVIDIARRMARPCNAQAGIGMTGKLFAARVAFGASVATLDAQGRRLPPVAEVIEEGVSPPYKRVEFGAQRVWRVHSFSELAFQATLVPMGRRDAAKTYREGNIVDLADQSTWLYINPTPTAGNAPPSAGSFPRSDAYWQELTPPILASGVAYADGTPVETLKPSEAASDVTMLATGPTSATFAFDYTGVAKTGQLPRNIEFKLIRGSGIDVTTSAAWSVALKSGSASATVGAATGLLNVTAVNSDAVMEITALLDGITRTAAISLLRSQDPAPSGGGGGGGTTDSTSTIADSVGSTYGAANTRTLTVRTGTAGQIDLTFPAEFFLSADGSTGAEGKWQIDNSGWADVPGAIGSSSNAARADGDYINNPGFVAVTRQVTGLTPNTDYDVRLVLRATTSATISWIGTASGVGS